MEERLLDRWIRFNGVGALGILVQLAILGTVVRFSAVSYLVATAIAVEAAVLHNFVWHERWTWASRRSRSAMMLLSRLCRFHVLNGTISMAGNLAVMYLLVGTLQADPIVANILAIIACSIVNFGASELMVFRRPAGLATLMLFAAVSPALAADDATPYTTEMLAVDLQPQTVQAWNQYEQRVDTRYYAASAGTSPFFALDAFGIPGWRTTALGGSVAIGRIERAQPGGSGIDVPDGKIHHWAGAIFVPNTSVAAVLERLLHLAGTESKYYEEVIDSRLLARDGDRVSVFLKLRRSKYGVSATYNTEHSLEYRRLGPSKASSRSVATRISQLDDAGTPQERERPVGSDSGYLWRLNAYWRYEAVNNGVLIECESVSLSRSVPALLRPFISGVVEGLARESLENTLTGLRKVLTARSVSENGLHAPGPQNAHRR